MNSKEVAKIIHHAYDQANSLDIDSCQGRWSMRETMYIVIKAFGEAFKEEEGFDFEDFESRCYGLKS